MKSFKPTKIAVIFAIFLMISPILMMTNDTIIPAKAQLATKQPISGPLPAGITPNETFTIQAYLSFTPNPVGLGQTILVNMWTTPGLNPHRFHQGYKVTIMLPDQTQDVRLSTHTVQTQRLRLRYTVTQVGTYRLKFEFPGEYYPAGQYYETDGVSDPAHLATSLNQLTTLLLFSRTDPTVQSDMVASRPPSPLPTDYWTRPAHLENRESVVNFRLLSSDGVVGGGPDWPDDTNAYIEQLRIHSSTSKHLILPTSSGTNSGGISGLTGGSAGIYGTLGYPGTP